MKKEKTWTFQHRIGTPNLTLSPGHFNLAIGAMTTYTVREKNRVPPIIYKFVTPLPILALGRNR